MADPVTTPTVTQQNGAVTHGISDEDLTAAARLAQQGTLPAGEPSSDDQLLTAAARQAKFESMSVPERLGLIAQTGEHVVAREVAQVLGIPAAGAQAGAAFVQAREPPNLQGLPVAQVKTLRDQMQQELDQTNKTVDEMLKTGDPDENYVHDYSYRINSLEARIKDANDIITTGIPQTVESPTTSAVGWALREYGKQASAPAITQAFERVFPANQDFDNSLFGHIVNGGADALTMGALGLALGPAASTAYATSQMSEQVYQAKKDAGASDADAERASALTSLAALPTMAVGGPTIDFLAKSFAGLSAKQGIRALIRAGVGAVGGGAEFAGLDLEQQAIGQLQGYDPNHPLDRVNWWNVFLGAAFHAFHGLTMKDPRMARLNKPSVDVRTREEPALPPGIQPRPWPPPWEQPAEPVTAAPPPAPPAPGVAAAPVVAAPKADAETEFNKFADEVTKEVPPTPPPVKEAAPAITVTVPPTETLERQGEAAAPAAAPAEVRPWWEQEPAAARIPLPRTEAVDRPVDQTAVKQEVQDAQAQMGMHDNLLYHPTVEDLPSHVLAGLTPAERNATAQIVVDRKLGNVHVIGDRFSTLNELRRGIIEEAIPYRFRNTAEITTKHDPTDRDFGSYDHISDNPELNTHALLLADRPYEEALKTANEEVNVHKGISTLLGPLYGRNYVNAMHDVFTQFQRLGLLDTLAQKKGYTDVDHMAAPDNYNVPDWRTDPRQRNKLTEELIGAYSRTFPTPEALAADAPAWYQTALRRIQNGVRSFLGLKLTPYDVQSLLHDSAAALRTAKRTDPIDYHPPTGESAKADMDAFRFANRPPGPPGAPGEPAPPEVDITGELVRGRIAELEAGLQPGQQLAAQPLRLAMQQRRSVQERMAFLDEWPAIINHEGHQEIMSTVLDMLRQDFHNDPNEAMDFIINHRITGARNPTLTEVVGRHASDTIDALRAAGENDQADLMAARLDRMNKIQAADPTEAARELAAQKLRTTSGSGLVARHKEFVQKGQRADVNATPSVKAKVDTALDQVKQATKDAAQSLRDKADAGIKKIAARWGTTMNLPEQYLQDLVDRIHDAMFKTNTGFTQADTPVLQRVYDTLRQNIQQIIRERIPKEPTEKPPQPAATDTLRTIMDNEPHYKEAWSRTMDMLYSENPDLAQRFARAIEEPVGETLANKLAAQQGQTLSDLIFNHYSTTDRINQDLATKITQQTGMQGTVAQGLSQRLQNLFGQIVRGEQQDKLQSILDSVGGQNKPPKGELAHLVDHIVIGGLDSDEWLNHVAPRFGIDHYDQATLDRLRTSGDEMARLRDQGLENSVAAQKFRKDIGDIMRMNSVGPVQRAIRYIMDVYVAGILNGIYTHLPYFQQIWFNQTWDSLVQGLRSLHAAKTTEDAGYLASGMVARWANGMARGAREFMPILRYGLHPDEEFMPTRGDQPLSSSMLERVQPELGKPATWYSNYKYVRNALNAISNLMVRGPQYALSHAIEMEDAWDHDMTGKDAYDSAKTAVLGDFDAQERAKSDAQDISQQYNLNKAEQTLLEGQLLDQYKTERQTPDGAVSSLETVQARERAQRAFAGSLFGTLRGETVGLLGPYSRGLTSFTNRFPATKPIAPFVNVPFNFVNQTMAWSPIGIARSIADLVEPDSKFGSLIAQTPLRRGVRSYLEGGLNTKTRLARGEITPDMVRDEAWRQMSRGVVGTAVLGTLGALAKSTLSQENPFFRLTYNGPDTYGQQEIERGKGWQQKSFYLDPKIFGAAGGWHSYENTPFRPMLALLGAYSDYFRYHKKPGEDWTAGDEPNAIVNGIGSSLTSLFGSSLQGLDAALNFLSESSVTDAEGAKRAVGNFLTAIAGAAVTELVPSPLFTGSMARQFYRSYDPTVYESPDPKNYFQKLLRYIPVVNSMTLEPKLNVFGEHVFSSPLRNIPQYSPSGGLLGTGVGRTVDPEDPVWNYLATHPGIRLTMPGNNASVARVKMTPEEIYQYHLARGPALKQMLARAFADPHFAELPEPTQNQIIKRTFERAAIRVGQAAVMQYRGAHPVTPERLQAARTARGIAETSELESQMAGPPAVAQPAAAGE